MLTHSDTFFFLMYGTLLFPFSEITVYSLCKMTIITIFDYLYMYHHIVFYCFFTGDKDQFCHSLWFAWHVTLGTLSTLKAVTLANSESNHWNCLLLWPYWFSFKGQILDHLGLVSAYHYYKNHKRYHCISSSHFIVNGTTTITLSLTLHFLL